MSPAEYHNAVEALAALIAASWTEVGLMGTGTPATDSPGGTR